MDLISPIVEDLFDSGKTILFLGAGISFQSGIPFVQPFISELFNQLEAEKGHAGLYLSQQYPFEAMVENINERVLIKDLFLSIFGIENPGISHRYFAHLAFIGKLHFIVTTNFDRNLEVALEEVGMIEGKNFVVITNLENLNINVHDSKVILLKLHGTINNYDSLVTTIFAVANKQNIKLVKEALWQLLSNPSSDNLLFWGYGFSDQFDISPALRSLDIKGKKVYSVEHNIEKSELEEIRLLNKPFISNKFLSATGLHCNSDELLIKLTHSIDMQFKSILPISWQTKLRDWVQITFTGQGLNNKNLMLSHLFSQIGNLKLGIYYADKELKNLKSNDPLLKMDLYAKLGYCYMANSNQRNVPKAKECFEKAVEISMLCGDELNFAIHSGNLANCYLELKDYGRAEKMYIKTIAINRDMSERDPKNMKIKEDELGYQAQLGICYRRQGRLLDSQNIFQKILLSAEKYGFQKIKDLCLSSLAKVYYLKKDYKTELKYNLEAYELEKSLKLAYRIEPQFQIVFSNLIRVYGIDKAKEFYFNEIEFFEMIMGFRISIDKIKPIF